jgi:hypothetical protein
MSWRSVIRVRPPDAISCSTLTNTSSPDRPDFRSTEASVERRSRAAPSETGWWKAIRLPAHMRRGSSTGGRKPPRAG